MAVPFSPADCASHRARFQRAFESLFHAEDVVRGGDAPDRHPECCFDFVDGMRLVVYRMFLDDEERKYVVPILPRSAPASFVCYFAVTHFVEIADKDYELSVGEVDGIPMLRIEE